MKKVIEKITVIALCVIMIFGSAPLSGFVGLELPNFADLFVAKASAEEERTISRSGTGWTLYDDGELVVSANVSFSYRYDKGTTSSINYATFTWPWGNKVIAYGGVGGPSTNINGMDDIYTITVTEGVTRVNDYIFAELPNLESVTLPNSITTIGGGIFCGCSSLKYINYDNVFFSLDSASVAYTTPDSGMFEGCSSLEHIKLRNISSIGLDAFNGCSSLKTIDFEDGCFITEIGESAFQNCSSLSDLSIPGQYSNIPKSCFRNCISLKNFNPELMTLDNPYYEPGNSIVMFPDSLTTIESSAFLDCHSIKYVQIPSGVSTINSSFRDCYSLERLVINEGVTKISSYGFQYCPNLEIIVIPLSMSNIGSAAFKACVSINTVIYPGAFDFWSEITITETDNEFFIGARKIYGHWHDSHAETYLKGYLKETCETSGYTGDRCCVICGWCFEKGEVIPATGHDFQETVIEPTCSSNGFRYRVCANCGKSNIDEIYSATGHEYTSKIVRPTCTDGGYTLNVCNKCGLSTITDETDPLGHDYVPTVYEATCTRDGYTLYQCSRCNASYIDNIVTATGHTYVDTEVQSTCTGTGYTSHKCSKCGDEYVTNETPANGHSYEPVTVPATCTTDGYVIYICSDCGAAYRGEQIPSPGHNYRDTVVTPTCTEGGYTIHTCSACGNTYIDSETDALGHSYTETVVEATCQHGGYTRHECRNCHDIYDTDETPALEHNLEEAVVEATCTTGGFTINTCSDCGYTIITNRTNATGHNYQPKIVIQQTCIQDGYTISICENCGASSSTEGMPATGHSFGNWSTVENATEEHEGLQQRHCQNCGYCEEKLLPIVNRTTFNVTFKADEKTVAVVEYVKGTRTIEEPAVPHKDRFEGRWENYTLNDEDITVNAVYTVIDLDTVDGVDSGESAVYNPVSGVATINMYAASSGKTIISTSSEAVPLDIILVVDQSGSMDDKLGGVGVTKKQALINSANSFVNSVYDDAAEYNVNHRVAIVGFAMGKDGAGAEYPAFLNTEILTTGGAPVQMNNATPATYANALMPVNVNGSLNSGITTALNNIDAKGATAADYGLSMANNIFANSTGSEGRERVVVFMTDGAPTYQSNFSTTVANAAILQANELKTAYGATIYSVGTMDSTEASNANISRFMNYVSSNYEDAKSLGGTATYKSSNYYYNVTNTSALSGVFSKIVTENITRTTDFDNITMINTVSKYFTLTANQEKALRVSVIETYGVKNSDITVTRNSDGTTTIIIRKLHPVDNGTQFVVDITFEVSANENANSAGVYPVGTDDSGIILGDAENYEFVFSVPHITVPADRKTAVFTVNGETYYITTVIGSNAPTAPITDFAGQYEFSGWNINESEIADGYAVYDAAFASQEYVIIWNTAEGTSRVTYRPGDVIDEPDAGENSNGEAFRRWNGTVPVTMPDHSIEFTAVYGDHEHRYEAETITAMTCTQDGLVRYTCSVCGDTYDETVTCPGEHEWITATSESGDEESEQIIICKRCGVLEERMLQYSSIQTEANDRGHSDFIAQELNLVDNLGTCYQPDGTINISMPIDGENQIFDMSVCRVGDNGEEIDCESDYENGVVSFDADHFSTYRFIPVYMCEITGKHIDTNSDNYCDICDKKLIEEATVTFIVDSEVYSTGTYTVGSQTVIPDSPQKTGFTFTGWSPEISETVSAGETVYVAKWQAPEHTCSGTVIGARAATCSKAGYTGDTYCSICGELLETGEAIPAGGHRYGSWSGWKNSGTGKESRYRVCSECGHRDVESKNTFAGGTTVSLDKLIDLFFSRILKMIFRLFKVEYHGKYE